MLIIKMEEFNNACDYNDVQEVVKQFLRCSITDDFTEFDFERAFECVKVQIHERLMLNGLTNFEEYLEYMYELTSSKEIEELGKNYGIQNDWVYVSGDDIFRAIQKINYDRMNETFKENCTFEEIERVYNKLECVLSLQENILLFDECIHLEHEYGSVLDINVDDLKEEVEGELGN